MARGGRREGAGRPKGAQNKRTQELVAKIEASGMSPIDFMVSVMRDDAAVLGMRLEVARSVAPFLHPKLSTVEVKRPEEPLPSEADLLARIRAIVDANPSLGANLDELVRPPH